MLGAHGDADLKNLFKCLHPWLVFAVVSREPPRCDESCFVPGLGVWKAPLAKINLKQLNPCQV